MVLLSRMTQSSMLIWILKFLILPIGLFVFSMSSFAEELPPNLTKVDPLHVKINMLSFNPHIGDLDVRLEMVLPKALIGNHYSPKADIYLVDMFSVEHPIIKIPAEKRFSIFDTVILTRYQVDDAGTQFLYPFDVHHTHIGFFAEMAVSDKSSSSSVLKRIPIIYDCALCSFEGFDIKMSEIKNFSKDFINLDVSLHRSKAVIVFSVLIIFGMWVVGASVIILTYRVIKSKVAPDVAALGFTGGLLFALPAVRAIQPMVPPVGILADYVGFFWVELLTIVALIIMVMCWAHRNK